MKKIQSTLVCAVLAAGLLAGCGSKVDGTQAAITVNGEEIDLGTAVFTLRAQQAETGMIMEMYGFGMDGTSFWDQNTTDEDGKSMTYGEQMKDSIEEDLVSDVLLRSHAEDYGVTLSDEVRQAAEEAAHTVYADNTDMMEELGVTEENIRESMELYAWPVLMKDVMTADVDLEVSDEEAAQSRAVYARINLQKPDDDGNPTVATEETIAEYKASLEKLLQQIEAADTVDEDAIDGMAGAIDDENIMVGGLTYGAGDAFLPEEVLEAAATLQDGETYGEVIETEDNYLYLIHMVSVLDRDATDRKKTSIAGERQQEAYDAILQEWKDASEISTSDAWAAITVKDSENWKAVKAADETAAEETDEAAEEAADETTAEETDEAAEEAADEPAAEETDEPAEEAEETAEE